MSAVVTEDEKNRVRHHLGYILVNPVSSIQLGVPRASQSMFLVESSLNNIPESAVGLIRRYIAILDNLEDKLVESVTRFSAKALGDITLRDDEPDKIEKEYVRWAKRLADDLGCPINIYSERYRNAGGASINIPVRN